jgi:hypothetical protein
MYPMTRDTLGKILVSNWSTSIERSDRCGTLTRRLPIKQNPEIKTIPSERRPQKNKIVDETLPNTPENNNEPKTPNTQIP